MNVHRLQRRARGLSARARPHLWRRLHPGIEIGQAVRIGGGCRLTLDPDARLVLEAGCEIYPGATIAVYGSGCLRLGARCVIGHHCTLAARSDVTIGAGTFLAELVSVRDHDHAVGVPPLEDVMTVEPVRIGENAWVGAKVTVLRGAHIGDGVVVGANAVVRGSLPPRTVCVGAPARVVRTLDGSGAPARTGTP